MRILKKILYSPINFFNVVYNKIVFKLKKVSYLKCIKINGRIHIYGTKGTIFIGENFLCNSGKNKNPIGGSTEMILAVRDNGNIIIGNNVGISNSAIVSMNKIFIEDDVMIGGGCKIYDTDFHSIDFTHRMETPDKHIKSLPVIIKKGAFIGAHSIILKGVTIGENSIVGAGSVVAKNVPNGEIWAGNPARFIRRIYG